MLREMGTHWPSSESKRAVIRQTRLTMRQVQTKRTADWIAEHRGEALTSALVAKVWLLVWWQLAPDCEPPPMAVRSGPAPQADARDVRNVLVTLGWTVAKATQLARPVYAAQTDGQMDGDRYVSQIYGVTYGARYEHSSGSGGGNGPRVGGKRADVRMARAAAGKGASGKSTSRPGPVEMTTEVVATPVDPAEEKTMKMTMTEGGGS